MSLALHIRPQARRDINRIAADLDDRAPHAGVRFLADVQAAFQRLTTFPDSAHRGQQAIRPTPTYGGWSYVDFLCPSSTEPATPPSPLSACSTRHAISHRSSRTSKFLRFAPDELRQVLQL